MKTRSDENPAFGMRGKSQPWLRGIFWMERLRGTEKKFHEVKVITAQGNQPSIVRELGSEKTGQLFRFAESKPLIIQNRMLARNRSWRHSLCV